MTVRRNDWLTPQAIFAGISLLIAFITFCVTFDRRLTQAEASVAAIAEKLRDHKDDEKDKLHSIEQKLDSLIERKGGR